MATSAVGRAIGQRMSKIASEIAVAPHSAVMRGAMEAKTTIGAKIKQASGGDNRLSGVGRSGARVGVRFDIKGTTNPTALVRATGPAHLVERPSKPHEIKPRRRRGGGKRAVVTPAGLRAKVQHPGVRSVPKPFEKGFQQAEPRIRKEVSKVFGAAFARGATK